MARNLLSSHGDGDLYLPLSLRNRIMLRKNTKKVFMTENILDFPEKYSFFFQFLLIAHVRVRYPVEDLHGRECISLAYRL